MFHSLPLVPLVPLVAHATRASRATAGRLAAAVAVAVGVTAACVTGPAFGQGVVLTVPGDRPGQRLGSAVDVVGDVDGDGHCDFVVGAEQDGPNGAWSGSARMVSGRDGRTLWSIAGTAPGDRLGAVVAGVGHVDADGVPDAAVAAPFSDAATTDGGLVLVLSGADGSVLHRFLGTAPFAQLGTALDGAGDIDGDNRADIVVGTPHAQTGGVRAGMAVVLSGATGGVLFRKDGAAEDLLGWSVAGIGDVDNDRRADFAIGAIEVFRGGRGFVEAYSGRTGSRIWRVDGTVFQGRLGWSMDGGQDVDDDGVPDVVAGIRGKDTFGFNAGGADVLSGIDGSVLLSLDGNRPFLQAGAGVALAGDLDGDDHADVAFGSDLNSEYFAFSGATGQLLFSLRGGGRDSKALAGGGDVDRDGDDDLLVGLPRADGTGVGIESGAVIVHQDGPRALEADVHTVSVSSGGTQRFALDAGAGSAGRTYLLVGSLSGIDPGLPLGAVRLRINPDFYTIATAGSPNSPPLFNSAGTLDGSGRAQGGFRLPVNSDPGLAGLRFDHAYLLLPLPQQSFDFASNPVPLRLVP